MKRQCDKEPGKGELLLSFCGPSTLICWVLALINFFVVCRRPEQSAAYVIIIIVLVLFPFLANLRAIWQVMRGEARRHSGVIAAVQRPAPVQDEKGTTMLTLKDGGKYIVNRESNLNFALEPGTDIDFIYLEGRKKDDYDLIVKFLEKTPEYK